MRKCELSERVVIDSNSEDLETQTGWKYFREEIVNRQEFKVRVFIFYQFFEKFIAKIAEDFNNNKV